MIEHVPDVPPLRRILFDLFKKLPTNLRTRENWKQYADQLHKLPGLNPNLANIIEMAYVFDTMPIIKAVGLTVQGDVNTTSICYVDCYIGDVVIDSQTKQGNDHKKALHTIRGVIVSIQSDYRIFLKRHVFSDLEIITGMFHPHVHRFDFLDEGIHSDENWDETPNCEMLYYGVDMHHRDSHVCKGTYEGPLYQYRNELEDDTSDDRLLTIMLLFNLVYDFLASQTSNDALYNLTILNKTYREKVYSVNMFHHEMHQLLSDGSIEIVEVKQRQNSVLYQMMVHNTPDYIRNNTSYRAYYHEQGYYRSYELSEDSGLDFDELEEAIIEQDATTLFNNQPIDITVYEQPEEESQPEKVFIEDLFQRNEQKIIDYYIKNAQSIRESISAMETERRLDQDRHGSDPESIAASGREHLESAPLST